MEINDLSRPAQDVLIKIALGWDIIIGPSGSYVHDTSLKKLLEAQQPISINKMTNSGRGRNGVIYSIIPMCQKHRLIEIMGNGNHTKYLLNDLGREVIGAMLSTCSYCSGTKLCRFCRDGVQISNCCDHGDWNGNNYEYKSPEACEECINGLMKCSACINEPGVCDRCGGIEIEDPLIQHVGVIY